MLSRRIRYSLLVGVLVTIILCMGIYHGNPNLVMKPALKDLLYEGRIYGKDKNCKEYISTNRITNIKRLLNMKTTPEVEDHLHRLGYPNRITTSGDIYIPDLPDLNIPIPRIPVIVAGASNNHFTEMQAMMHNIDTVLRPVYPDIKVILYDIGFTESQRQAIINYGRCEFRTFNFEKYPKHVKVIRSYSWKPLIIQEVLNEYGFIMYMDASIRFTTGNLTSSFNDVKKKGLTHLYAYTYFIPNNTFAETFEYFNVEPCLLHGLYETGSGLILVVKNNLYGYAMMRSWLTCGLQRYCFEPKGSRCQDACGSRKEYHTCHRFDQSALGIAIAMTFLDESHGVPRQFYHVGRGDRMDYFKNISKGIIGPKSDGRTAGPKSDGKTEPKSGGKTRPNPRSKTGPKPGGKREHE
ncbi:uncharacterized protein LOC126832275 [Patella vulgata]|uniref:uncharacterized protein LOC126832275 n=1 Tax=Patella vulgata TaxID=6465 RepID=UPI002180237F|nr:uncharacterized protein LOC126832275 [Patella vulgata]